MKKTVIAISTFILATTLSFNVFAADTTSTVPVQGPAMTSTPPPAAMSGGPQPAVMSGPQQPVTTQISMQPTGIVKEEHPCHAHEEACKSAGFVRGGYKTGKGLFENCMKPIISGLVVNGVIVNPADVQACKAKREAWKNEQK